MPLPFERFESVVSQKVATVVADGSLRQFAFNVKNMNQHWLKLHQQNPADGTFKIICRASNKVIDAAGENLAIHTHLQQFVDTGSINQRWKIVPTDEDPNVFFIKAIDTNRVWDVPDASLADGVQLQLFQLHGGNNQRWRIRPVEAVDHVFKIRSVASNLVLDMPGFSQNDGGFIQQFQNNDGFNQLWQFIPLPDGRTKIRSVCSGKLLDYPLQSALQNQPAFVGQFDDNNGDNQTWKIKILNQDALGHDVVNIISGFSVNNGLFLDVPNSSIATGVHIQTFPNNGGLNQRWQLTEVF